MTKDEALKMAIDYLGGSYEAHKVRKACQEALEQPTQEPVAWTGSGSIRTIEAGGEGFIWGTKAKAYPIPLYTHPAPSWQKLSDDEILDLATEFLETMSFVGFARAIEQASRNKNGY